MTLWKRVVKYHSIRALLLGTVLAISCSASAGQSPIAAEAFSRSIADALGKEVQYPLEARSKGEEGVARIRVRLKRDGTVVDTAVVESSGHAALDTEAADVFHRLGHLSAVPGEMSKGSPLVSIVIPVNFALRDPAPVVPDGVPYRDPGALTLSDERWPPSAWLTTRSHRFLALAAHSNPCEALVVPVQVEARAFDWPTRQIMSAEVARSLASPSVCVADPYLADLALGEGLRRRGDREIQALAAAFKATTIIKVFAGHNGAGHMRVTIQVDRTSDAAATTSRAHSIDKCTFDDTHLPIQCFREQLPALLESVGLKQAGNVPAALGTMPAHLPESPKRFVQQPSTDVLADASSLMFLATLAPASESRAAERLFTKAWIRLEDAQTNDPIVQRLRARIMLNLHERPYALSLIATDASPEADGLRAVLNADLPALRKRLSKADDDWERFFLGIDEHDLAEIYDRDTKASKKAMLDRFAKSPWQDLVEARLGEYDDWFTVNTVSLKKLLDEVFPIPGLELSSQVAGTLVVGAPNFADVQLFAPRHVDRVIEQQPEKFCCKSFTTASPGNADLLDLIDGRIQAALTKQVKFLTKTYGQPAQSVLMLDAYNGQMGGNPDFESERARTYKKILEEGNQADRASLRSRKIEAAKLSALWDQRQSYATSFALYYLETDGGLPTPGIGAYDGDYPIRSNWTHLNDSARRRLPYSTYNAEPIRDLIEKGGDIQQWEDQLKFRFIGSATADELRLAHMDASEKTPANLRASLDADPANRELRSSLAMLLMDRGEFADVPPVILGNPLFQMPAENTVQLSNIAFDWGDRLLWKGAFEPARVLLKRAAGYRDNSTANIGARGRLALLDKDYGNAASAFLTVARLYRDPRRYDDFLRLMFASGRDREGWAIFDEILSKFRAFQIWTAAMTGNRRAGLDTQQLRAWLSVHAAATSVNGTHDDIARYAFMEQVTDRVPPIDFAEFTAAFSGAADVIVESGQVTDRNPRDPEHRIAGPGEFGADRHPAIKDGASIPNHYALLAKALALFRSEQYALAAAAFDELGTYYDLESDELMFALPYFAVAEANSGNAFGLEKYLDKLSGEKVTFGVSLARAMFAGWNDRVDGGKADLDKAMQTWDKVYRTGDLQSSYVFMDLCAQLYEKKKNESCRLNALSLARTVMVVQPTDAYAPAFVAYLGDEAEHFAALSLALYLDPRSVWANKAPAELRTKAVAQAKEHPPFQLNAVQPAT